MRRGTTVAAALLGAALLWGLWLYGATEVWTRDALFLAALGAALLTTFTVFPPLKSPPGDTVSAHTLRRLLPFLALGLFLLVRAALEPSLEARGYVLASLGWLTALVTLALASRGRRAALWVLHFLVLAGALEAFYGIARAGGADQATGTLVNRNHFAGLLNMALPLAIGALYAGYARRRAGTSARSETYAWTWIMILSLSFIGLAILLSRSRGGALTLILTLAFLAALMTWRRRDHRGLPGLAVGLLLIAALGLWLALGPGALLERFTAMDDGSGQGRLAVYRDSLKLVRDHPLGVGPGMYRWRFRPYQTTESSIRFDHAHNDYLETAADWGLPVAFAFWAFVAWRLGRAVRLFRRDRDPRRLGVALGCAGAIVSILVHSLVDFNLQIPANWMYFCAVVTLAWSLERTAAPTGAGGGVKWIVPQLLLAAALLLAFWQGLPRFRAARWLHTQPSLEGVAQALAFDPNDPRYHFRLGVVYRDAPVERDLARARMHLERAVELNPFNWRYRRELAQLYELGGLQGEAEKSYLEAIRLSPGSADYRWRLANFYLRGNAPDKARPHLAAALDGDRRLLAPALELLLKSGFDPPEIAGVWPQDAPARRTLLTLLCRRQEPDPPRGRDFVPLGGIRGGDFVPLGGSKGGEDFVDDLWSELLAGDDPPPLAEGAVCVDFLLRRRRFAAARERWIELSRRHDVADPAYANGANRVWNGAFESEITGTVLDWHLANGPGYVMARRSDEGLGGSAALRLDFDGSRNLHLVARLQEVLVEGGRNHLFSYRVRAEEISTDQGIFLEVVDEAGKVLAAAAPVRGTVEWTRLESRFTSPRPGPQRLFVRVRRNQSARIDSLLRGTLRLDEIVIEVVQ